MLTRAEFLRLGTAASLGAWLDGPRVRAQSAASPEARERISRLIQQYDSQGIHRTATDGDNESARWLFDIVKEEVAKETVPASRFGELMPFLVPRVDVRAAYIQTNGARSARADGLPLFDGTFTDARGISGELVPAGKPGEIALVSVDAAGISSEGRSLQDLRRSGRYQGIVAITRGAHEGLSPMNAVDFAAPYGVPVLQVGSEAGAWLESAASAGAFVRFVADASRTNKRAWNVGARAFPVSNGAPTDVAPVVVMTPRSGWWRCASERGGGLACWTEAMRAVIASRPSRPVFFVASSGHELGHFGLDDYLSASAQRGLIQRAAAWVHLGANIGAAGGRLRIQASSDEIEAMGLAALASAGAPVPQRVPRGNVPGGEARNIHVGGGRYVSFLGSSNVFHSQADRWPDAVDVDAVTKYSAAVSDLVIKLAGTA